jgi:hypothetical protein
MSPEEFITYLRQHRESLIEAAKSVPDWNPDWTAALERCASAIDELIKRLGEAR